jgi:hypothetical protein
MHSFNTVVLFPATLTPPTTYGGEGGYILEHMMFGGRVVAEWGKGEEYYIEKIQRLVLYNPGLSYFMREFIYIRHVSPC